MKHKKAENIKRENTMNENAFATVHSGTVGDNLISFSLSAVISQFVLFA